MSRYLSILKPSIQKAVLDIEAVPFGRSSKITEKIQYLDIDTATDLNADICEGAVQFEPLKALIEKEKEPKYILISTDNKEQGYLAISYLQAEFNRKHGDYEKEVLKDGSVLEEWQETPFQIPIIEERELSTCFGNSKDNPFSMGDFYMQGNAASPERDPYWMTCTDGSVCILCSNKGFGFRMWDKSVLLDGLNHFRGNDKVYILNYEKKDEWEFSDFDDTSDGFLQDAGTERAGWNNVVLSYAVDEMDIQLTKGLQKKYYREVFRGVINQKSLKVKKGFSYDKLLNIVLKMQEEDKCRLIENIVNYAIKDRKESDTSELTNVDFAFIDRFIRVGVKQKEGERTSAKERLKIELIGMEAVKEQVLDIVNVMKYNKMRSDMKIYGGGYHNVHMMLGAPGTAKTTVAKLMGEIMVEERLLLDDRYICVNGAELKGKYVGHSAPKTKALFEEHDIIVIDEAYSLVGDNGEQDTFSKEAIAQLIIELEEHAMDKLVIFAGYGGCRVTDKNNKMKDFLNANPGIKSRITSTIYFDSYTPEDMTGIFLRLGQLQKYQVAPEAAELLHNYFKKRVLDENFGNGREARQLLETAVVFAAKRVMALSKKSYSKAEMQQLTAEDIKQAILYMEKQFEAQGGRSGQAIGFLRG